MPSITRVSRNQRQDKRQQVEQALIRATETLLDSGCSYTELSVEQLAQQAGIARSTFYLHFADKSDLVRRLVTRVTEEFVAACGRWWGVADTASWDDLVAGLDAVLQVYNRHRAVVTALQETAAYDATIGAVFEEMLDSVLRQSRQAHDRIKASGKLREGVTRDVATALTLMVERSCFQLGRGAAPARRRQIAEAMALIVWNAMYAEPPARTAVPRKARKRA